MNKFVILTESRELPRINHTQTDSKIYNRAKDNWSQNTRRNFRDNFSKEVRTDTIHIIVHLSQEDRPLIREDKNDILDRVERDSHSHEEERTISILNTLSCSINI